MSEKPESPKVHAGADQTPPGEGLDLLFRKLEEQKRLSQKEAAMIWGDTPGLEREITEEGLKESFDVLNAEGGRMCRVFVEYGEFTQNYRPLRSFRLLGEQGEEEKAVDLMSFLELQDVPVFVLSDAISEEERAKHLEKGTNNVVSFRGPHSVERQLNVDNLKNPAALAGFFHEAGHIAQLRDEHFVQLETLETPEELKSVLRKDDLQALQKKDVFQDEEIKRLNELVARAQNREDLRELADRVSEHARDLIAEQVEAAKELARIMLERDANARALKWMHALKTEQEINLLQPMRLPVKFMSPARMGLYRERLSEQGEDGGDIVINPQEHLGDVCMGSYEGTASQLKQKFGVIPRLRMEEE